MKLVKNCIYERLDTAIGVIDVDEPVIESGYIEVPEFEEVKTLDEVIGSDVSETEYIDKALDSIKSVPEEMELEPQIEVIRDVSDVPVVDNFTSIESTDLDLRDDVSVRDDFDFKADA